MAAITGRDIGAQIAHVLGLKHCIQLDLHIALDEIVTVTAKFFPEEDGVVALKPILEEFTLVRKDQKT